MSPELLTSAQNPKIKRLLALQKDSSLRRESGVFVVEGRRELAHCLRSGYSVDSVFFCPELYGIQDAASGRTAPGSCYNNPSLSPDFQSRTVPGAAPGRGAPGSCYKNPSLRSDFQSRPAPPGLPQLPEEIAGFVQWPANVKFFQISKDIYEKAAYRGSTEGIIAEVFTPHLSLEDLQLPDNPLIAVLESVEKPGNLGAVLRSADAAGADALLVCDPLTDIFNPNVIRASIGAVFTVPTVACTSAEAIAWLKRKGIQILTAQLQDSSLYYDTDMRRGTALVMGTESTGLSDAWRSAADAHIRIPMLGRLDSLNVSVSASILLFEAVRQRQEA